MAALMLLKKKPKSLSTAFLTRQKTETIYEIILSEYFMKKWPAIQSSREYSERERRMVELVGVEPTCRELANEVSYDSLS